MYRLGLFIGAPFLRVSHDIEGRGTYKMRQDIIDYLPVAVSELAPVYNDAHEIVDVECIVANATFNKSVLGKSGSLVGLRFSELNDRYDMAEIIAAATRAITENTIQHLTTGEGSSAPGERVVRLTFIPKDGTCVVCAQEITDIARAREDAEQELTYLKTAFDHSAQGMVLTNNQGEILYANNALADLLGYTVEELGNLNARDVVDPDEFELDAEIATQLLNGEIPSHTRNKYLITKGGEKAVVSINLSIGWSPNQHGYIFISHVICMREELLLQAEQEKTRDELDILKRSCDHAAEGLILINSKREITYANAAMTRIFGYSHSEYIGRDVFTLISEEDQALDIEATYKLLDGTIKRDIREKTGICSDGSLRAVSIALSILPKKKDQPITLIAHVRDVSEARATREALKDALSEATVATKLKSEFLANMSHEIRTPLNGVLGMAQVLANSKLTQEQAEHLSIIRESGHNLMVLLNDILDLSKIEAGKLEVSPIEADIRHKLGRVMKVHETAANAKNLGFQFVVHPSVPSRLEFDPVRLRQCIDNVVSNAIKFTREGEIIVAVMSKPSSAGKHQVTIHVSDTGPGIAFEQQDAVFKVFQQEDGSITRNHGGSGLGLAITRQLTNLMGGDISLKSQPGVGSIFTLTLECVVHEDVVIPDILSMNHNSLQPIIENALSHKRVLVVDDNAINRQVARGLLEARGMKGSEAENGLEALEKLAKDPYDIVLLDIHMPIMDGVRTIKKIRQLDSDLANIPVIALTADAMTGDREKYLSMGMTGYVSKPIDEEVLIAEVTECLSKANQLAVAS